MVRAICQRCAEVESAWNVHQAEFHVGEIKNWKVQLCDRCALHVQMIVRDALQPLVGSSKYGQVGGAIKTPQSAGAVDPQAEASPK
jgi:hypothetical protein